MSNYLFITFILQRRLKNFGTGIILGSNCYVVKVKQEGPSPTLCGSAISSWGDTMVYSRN